MLRKIIGLRGAITKSADDKVRHAKWLELNAALLEARKSHLSCIREEVHEISEDSLAVMSVAALDDTLIIPVILLVLSELKSAHETRLSSLLQTLTAKDVVKECKAKSMIDLLNSLLSKPVERLFEQFLYEKKCDQITAASVGEFMSATTAALCKALAVKAKIDPAKLSTEFTACVTNELVRACMHEIFQVTDHQQTAGVFSTIFSSITLSHDKIIKPYLSLPFCAASLMSGQAVVPLWSELARWFDGLHYYHFKLLQTKLREDEAVFSVVEGAIIMPENKAYPPANQVDAGMFKLYGLTLYDLARPVLAAREVLAKHLPAAQKEYDNIAVTVHIHGVFAINQSAAAAAAAASIGTDVEQVTQSAPNLNS